MHTAELLDEALTLATQLGYRVRHDWLDGTGGMCVVRGEKWLFIDLAQPHSEQLASAAAVLRDEMKLLQSNPNSRLATFLESINAEHDH